MYYVYKLRFFAKKIDLDIHVYTRPFFFDNMHPCPVLSLCPCKQCLGWALKWTKLQIPPNYFVALRSSSAVISSPRCYYLSVLASLCAMVLSVLRSYLTSWWAFVPRLDRSVSCDLSKILSK
jgi:hypothetical protein